MIKFFRKIRFDLLEKNKTGKYLLYAIGEIILVVLGILIALQINNWNESNKISKEEHGLLVNLKRDFTSNMKLINSGLDDYNIDLAYQEAAIRYTGPNVRIPTNAAIDSVSYINYTIVELVYGSINPTFNPNRIELLVNENLRGKIADFMVALTKYKEGENVSKELALELRRIHQNYIWLMENNNWSIGVNDEQSLNPASDYTGWFRDRKHQNVAADRTGAIKYCINQLTSLQKQIITIQDLIEIELRRF